MDTPEQVRDLLIQHGLADKADALMALLRPSIRIFTQPADDASLPIGTSKIGGVPDLPAGFEWPMWKHAPYSRYAPKVEKTTPLDFLAQFNLGEVAPFDTQHLLPSSGMLHFFYDGIEQPWYVWIKDGGALIYYYDGTDVRRTPAAENLSRESRFKPCGVTFKTELTLPSFFSSQVEYPYSDRMINPDAIHLSKEEVESYETVENLLYEDTNTMWRSAHRLLGYAQPVQFSAEPLGSLLLLQLDSDDYAGMMWGDVGKLYFWLPEAALAARRFNDGEMELQCS